MLLGVINSVNHGSSFSNFQLLLHFPAPEKHTRASTSGHVIYDATQEFMAVNVLKQRSMINEPNLYIFRFPTRARRAMRFMNNEIGWWTGVRAALFQVIWPSECR
jgi:hypothetical protein